MILVFRLLRNIRDWFDCGGLIGRVGEEGERGGKREGGRGRKGEEGGICLFVSCWDLNK